MLLVNYILYDKVVRAKLKHKLRQKKSWKVRNMKWVEVAQWCFLLMMSMQHKVRWTITYGVCVRKVVELAGGRSVIKRPTLSNVLPGNILSRIVQEISWIFGLFGMLSVSSNIILGLGFFGHCNKFIIKNNKSADLHIPTIAV